MNTSSADLHTTYPVDLLAREPAPPYAGEGGFALWHYSEDASLTRFQPRAPAGDPAGPPLVLLSLC